ncbi:MAG: phage portal protein [Oscillospiraceae bacterium]|nr:phage portal protein [Oscillospiraceae bacterium]
MKYLKIKNFFTPQKKAVAVQTARENANPLHHWPGYTPLAPPEHGLYTAMRESVPIIDAALDKIVRLAGGFTVVCPGAQAALDHFVSTVRVGAGSVGLYQFIAVYLDSLITYGNAVGEIILTADGGDIMALYNAGLENISIRQGKSPLDVEIGVSGAGLDFKPVPYPELVLFTPLSPKPGAVTGTSLLRSLPFVTSVLLEIYGSIKTNFQRVANLRYAVTYKPGSSALDKAHAKDIAASMASEWRDAMDSAAAGHIKDFVAVGDVDIKVIGADNQMIATEVPVRQMLEQIVAKLGIPPFMLGLHWSTTERMSTQQADILTSELESYRVALGSVITKICTLWLRLHGYGGACRVVWDDINLQDELEAARARLIDAQARVLGDREGGAGSDAII